MSPDNIWQFVKESNAIENITRNPSSLEIDAHVDFLALPKITLAALENFTWTVTKGVGVLRRHSGMDVLIGDRQPVKGGQMVEPHLVEILKAVETEHPWRIHYLYEHLHPFMDGNGRSGRAIWGWQMVNQGHDGWGIDLKFLRAFYYQTLDQGRP